jgi:hypothetical protein
LQIEDESKKTKIKINSAFGHPPSTIGHPNNAHNSRNIKKSKRA